MHRENVRSKVIGDVMRMNYCSSVYCMKLISPISSETTWFPRREIHRVKVYYDHCRSYYPNSSRIPHPYNDNIRVQLVRNYINYYIAALAESKVAFIKNSLKIRSPNLSVGTNPSTVKLLRAILLSRTCVPKFISTICIGHSHPMSNALCKLDASWI